LNKTQNAKNYVGDNHSDTSIYHGIGIISTFITINRERVQEQFQNFINYLGSIIFFHSARFAAAKIIDISKKSEEMSTSSVAAIFPILLLQHC
jgi:hypothetical protein